MLQVFKKPAVALSSLALAAGFSLSLHAAPVKHVAVAAIVEHPALDSVRDGVYDELKAAGFIENKNLKWQYQSAQGNTGTAAQIARKFVGDRPDVLVGIATPTSQALLAATKRLPIVFSAVTDPVAAQLTTGWEATGRNITGVSDVLELEQQVELIKKLIPEVKTIGMVYNPGEANSVSVIENLEKILPQHSIKLLTAAAPRTVDVSSAARSLVGKVDVIYTNTDNNVVSAYEALAKVGNDTKTPLVASDTDSVARGAIAALGLNYYNHGRQAGKVVVQILQGEDVGKIQPQTTENLDLHLNVTAAEKQGVRLSEELINSASKIIR